MKSIRNSSFDNDGNRVSSNRNISRSSSRQKRNQDEEKKQTIKIELAAKQSALLAQPSKNRGGKNSRKKSARTSFVLSENENDNNEFASDMPTDTIPNPNSKPDRVSLKRALRKPGHGLRGKSVRFSESESCGSGSFEVFEAFTPDPYGVR
jgi:hypothetical protein